MGAGSKSIWPSNYFLCSVPYLIKLFILYMDFGSNIFVRNTISV